MRHLPTFATALALVHLCSCEEPADFEGASQAVGGAPTPVIVHFAHGVDLAALASAGAPGRPALIQALRNDAAQAQAQALQILQQHGIQPSARLWMINALAATVPPGLLDDLEALPEVESIEPDLLVTSPSSGSGSATVTDWNLSAVGAPDLWAAGHRGAGVVVAALDTGADSAHPDLAASWRSAAGWYDPNGEHASPFDSSGHGTQVMGLIVGGDSSGSPIGVAPDAQWIAAKIFDDAGVASLSGIHLALQWTLDPDGDPATADTADIVNNSWGFSSLVNQCYLELEPDLAALRAAQVAVVFSAGNSGPLASSSLSPANNPSSFAAGAVDETLAVIAGSSRGPDACTGGIFPELAAPGDNVRTTDRTLGGQFPDSYVYVSGTSFAAPHVSGAMALLKSAHPEATVEQLEAALTETTLDLDPAGPDNDSGYGLPNLVAAEVRLAELVATPTCTDGDADGYFAEPGCNTSLDCNDGDATVYPGACDIKGDGIDQDCDGQDRLKGKPCPKSGGGGSGADAGVSPTPDAGVDAGVSPTPDAGVDAGVGSTPDAGVDAGVSPTPDASPWSPEDRRKTCTDGLDNDGDGLIDCADPDCAGVKKVCQ